ncbi:MAG: hypothetical protein J7515_11985 [Caulobacter sp.]|nr:hypothetical protein [Caulobacter sp.]
MIRRALLLLGLIAVVCGTGAVASAGDWPQDCTTRRVTGPGGAYRYDRVECEPQAVWSDFDRWAYERPLDVEDQPLRGDRYGGWTRIVPAPAPSNPVAPPPVYRVAGRDAGGFLIWPGKLP